MKQKLDETAKTFLALFLALAVAFGAFGVYWVLFDRELTFSQIFPYSQEDFLCFEVYVDYEVGKTAGNLLDMDEPECRQLLDLLGKQTYKRARAPLMDCYAHLTLWTTEPGSSVKIILSKQVLCITRDSGSSRRYEFLSGGEEVYAFLNRQVPTVGSMVPGETAWSWTIEYPDPS